MRRQEEIQSVRELGEAIGYGNLMSIASALWALKLKRDYGPELMSGAFVPTCHPFLNPKDEKQAVDERDRHISEIELYERTGSVNAR
jgi:hypothetical protein